ncbi:Regulatory-associated protein of TOR 2, partial [Camellia lanceoleosa]
MKWFCTRSLLRESLNCSLIDRIPGRQNDRKTLLGELNWIFTVDGDTISGMFSHMHFSLGLHNTAQSKHSVHNTAFGLHSEHTAQALEFLNTQLKLL